MELKLTTQENNILNFLQKRNNTDVFFEELVQFTKNPETVKLKTVQKAVSDLKKKYRDAGIQFPYTGNIFKMPEIKETSTQNLVKVKTTPGGNLMKVAEIVQQHPAQVDFVLDFNCKRVRTKTGAHSLNDNEWNVMKYLHSNAGKIISISELRDKVVFPQYGSKLPSRWFDSIGRIIHNLRKQVDGLEKRLLTVKAEETSYLFQ